MSRQIDPAQGQAAVAAWRQGDQSRNTLATAVRYTLQLLAEAAPGRSVEVRIPPFGAVQCVEGPRHTRGTPANVTETSAQLWLELATGAVGWHEALDSGQLRTSGNRADLSPWLPLPGCAATSE